MNRRLLRTTYHVEVEEINFTHGLPTWMTELVTGSSTTSTYDYTDPYGSHYAMMAKGAVGDGVTLSGSPLSTSVVKVMELEAIGVTVDGPAKLSLGLSSQSEGAAGIRLDAIPGDAGIAQAGRVCLQLQDGVSEGETILFSEGSEEKISDSKTVIEDLDLAVIVNSDTKMVQAHLGYSYVSCGPESFPLDQVLAPILKATLVADGEVTVKVRKLTIGTYT